MGLHAKLHFPLILKSLLPLCVAGADGEACIQSVLCIKARCEGDLPSWAASNVCNTGIQLLC